MTRPYHRNEPEPIILTEYVEPECIAFEYGSHSTTLVGFLADLYRGMVLIYGEQEAKERYWFMFHVKKDSAALQSNTVTA